MSDEEQDDEGRRWGMLLAMIAAIAGVVMAIRHMRNSD